MKKTPLLLFLLLIFLSGCNANREDNSNGKYITISIPEPNEIEQFTGPIENYSITTLTAEDFKRITYASNSPKGFEFSVYAKYVLKEYNNSIINIYIVKYDEEENVTDNINSIFSLFTNNLQNTGHKINIVNEFNFINYSVDSVRASYHKSWIYEGGSDFFVASAIFVKKGAYIIEVGENLNPNMKSIGQENLEKIMELVLKQNNFN